MAQNNNVNIEPFYSYRGVGKCYSRGISVFTDNFKCIFKFMWPITLACAFLYTLLHVAELFPYEITIAELELFKSYYFVILGLLFLIVHCIYISHVYVLIKLHASTYDLSKLSYKFIYKEAVRNLRTIAPYYVLMVVVYALTSFIYLSPIVFIFAMLILPCLILSGKSFWRGVWFGLKLGYKNFFRNLSMALLLVFTVGIILGLINLPVYMFHMMAQSADMSSLAGDTVNIPLKYYYIAPGVILLLSFITSFLSISFYMPLAYLYASAQVTYEEKLSNIRRD